MCTTILLLVAVPPVTENLTTTSWGREALGGMIFIMMVRIIPTSASSTTSPGNGCKNIKSTAEAINHGCVDAESR